MFPGTNPYQPDLDTPEDFDAYLKRKALSQLVPNARQPGSAGPGFDPTVRAGAPNWGDGLSPAAMTPDSSGASGMGSLGQPPVPKPDGDVSVGAGKVLKMTPPTQASAPAPAPTRQVPPTDYAGQTADLAKQQAALATPVGKTTDAGLAGQRPVQAGGSQGVLQRIAMAVLSATKLAPYANQIVHPKWSQQMAENAASQQAITQQEGTLEKAATAEEQQQRGALYAGQNDERLQAAQERAGAQKDAAQIRADQAAAALKQKSFDTLIGKRNPIYRPTGQQGPEDFEAIPIENPGAPGYTAWVPTSLISIPDELRPFMPQYQGHQQAPREEVDAAAATLRKQLETQNTAKQLEPNATVLAIRAAGGDPANPATITPQVAKHASEILKPQTPGINLTPEAVQFWAQAAANGVPLPAMGMGSAGATARQQIINAAPQAAGGQPLVANRANIHADTGSLANLTKTHDAVLAFENTAGKNLDLFLQQAKPIVDSGSPWANTPLRNVAAQGLGSQDQAAYNAARQVALTEIAKVVNNPALTGTLSDSARKEVTSLVPANATLGQIYRVANVLKQDMANRRAGLEQEIGTVQHRLGGQQHNDPLGVR